MSENILHQMIEERSARKEKAQAQMATLEAELNALDAEIRVLQEAVDRSSDAPNEDIHVEETAKAKERKPRPLKEEWADIMRFVGRSGEASLDEVMSYGDTKGYDLKRNTARSQFSIYRKEGWFEAVRTGVVRLTPAGAKKCWFVEDAESSLQQENEDASQKADESEPVNSNGPAQDWYDQMHEGDKHYGGG